MRSRPEPLSDLRFAQGESPRWDPRGDRLLWVDQVSRTLHVGVLDSSGLREQSQYLFEEGIGCAAPLAGQDGWIVASRRSFIAVSETDERVDVATGIGAAQEYFNDGGTDSSGRFWAGTQRMPRKPWCRLTSLEPDGSVVNRLDDVTVSNGLAFSADGRRLYYIDTLPDRRIEAFDVAGDGTLTWRSTVATIDGGNPDGLAIDLDGNLWVAVWDAGEVRHYAPHGQLLRTVHLPARRPTAVTMLGRLLVVTTARVGLTHPGEFDGAIFGFEVTVGGAPALPWAGRVPAITSTRSL